MSTPTLTTHELSCPNCGAPYTVPDFGNQVTCKYCGTRFVMPESVHPVVANTDISVTPEISLDIGRVQTDAMRWVKWLIIFIIVVTVVPTVCGIFASICGVFGAFVPFFVH